MKKIISIFLLTVACLTTVGCGVKGPLYFPAEEQPQQGQPE
ncbi:MAG TPA: hypothetical protein DD638_08120 [Pasteurellaceae bacterium]|nr:hypothetical protein [Pasteurellaceae bacterium]